MRYKRIYIDSVIEVVIVIEKLDNSSESIAIRYLKPENYKDKNGNEIIVTNSMGGETDWFILPFAFGATIGKKLIEQYFAGLEGFDNDGMEYLKKWLIDLEIIDDAMCY